MFWCILDDIEEKHKWSEHTRNRIQRLQKNSFMELDQRHHKREGSDHNKLFDPRIRTALCFGRR